MSVRRIIAFFILINVTVLFHSYAKDSTSILVFGDSIIAGYGLPEENMLTRRMETMLQEKSYAVHVINGGVSGDTTNAGRSRLEWTLQHSKPDIVIVALGGNDMLRGISPAITRENLDAILAVLQKQHIKTILSAVQAPTNLGVKYSSDFNRIYPDLAKKYAIPLYPFLLNATYGNPKLMQPDGIHPNAEGVQIIANGLVTYLINKGIVEKTH